MEIKLGKIEKVELRDIFKNEEYDFTPWLAKPENLSILADVIGIEINNPKLESSVGKFSSDINAEDENKDSITIEDQLEISDHEHLGKLITYSAGHESKTLIWIAREFREEHIQAINYLNEHTDEKVNIFAIQIELWKIGNSPIAPNFNIICKPNNWARIVRRSNGNSEKTETQLKQINFWINHQERLQNDKSEISVRSPERCDAYAFMKNKYKVPLYNLIGVKKIGCNLSLEGDGWEEVSNKLKENKESIENVFGTKLEWKLNKSSLVIRLLKDANYSNDKEFNINSKWLEETSLKFIKIFSPYINT